MKDELSVLLMSELIFVQEFIENNKAKIGMKITLRINIFLQIRKGDDNRA